MKKKLSLVFLTLLFPLLAFGQPSSSSTFTPSSADFSVILLSSIFGMVDGVLHGTGSQILGQMFYIFNAAVLSIGGIIITYVVVVGTMNTAHEGQFLGQKWSSIWIPLRSTIGVALIFPKASGYCLLQIFTMWIVVQGVGAANKIWSAALNYLGNGGVLYTNVGTSNQVTPFNYQSLFEGSGGAGNNLQGLSNNAGQILIGQVCMLVIENGLKNALQSYKQQAAQQQSGPCANPIPANMKDFCALNSVPSFLNSVFANYTVPQVSVTTSTCPTAPCPVAMQLSFPNFTTGPLASLQGICGQFGTSQATGWPLFDPKTDSTICTANNPNAASCPQQLATGRSLAIQQMYMDLQSIAQTIVQNIALNFTPQATTGLSVPSNWPCCSYPGSTISNFGYALDQNGNFCASPNQNCYYWGVSAGSGSSPILQGTQFLDAVNDYNGVMTPIIQSFNPTSFNSSDDSQTRAQFDQLMLQMQAQGWIVAGSYFYELVTLNNQNAPQNQTASEHDTNLPSVSPTVSFGTIDPSIDNIKALINRSCPNPPSANFSLCAAFSGDPSLINNVLLAVISSNSLAPPPMACNTTTMGSNVANYIANANCLNTTGASSGTSGVSSALSSSLGSALSGFSPLSGISLGSLTQDCGFFDIACNIGNIFIGIMNTIFSVLVGWLTQFVFIVINILAVIPIMGIALTFLNGINMLQGSPGSPPVNPIIGLAYMGSDYINFAINSVILLAVLGFALSAGSLGAAIPILGPVFLVLMPLFMVWTSIMMSIGFVTAYYVPFLPYIIFTLGAFGWLMTVIEAMVAAPIVALGIAHPEGHEAFGRGEQAIMILLNVFLRPSMMVIGFIAAIILSYVAVQLLNLGFVNTLSAIQGSQGIQGLYPSGLGNIVSQVLVSTTYGGMTPVYTQWTSLLSVIFQELIYIYLYILVVQKSFNLVSILPDKVLRWVGGTAETTGQEAAQWAEESKGQIKEAGSQVERGMGSMAEGATKYMEGKREAARSKLKSSELTPTHSTKDNSGGGGGAGGGGGGAGGKP